MTEFHAVFENVIQGKAPEWAGRSDRESAFIRLSPATTHDQITSFMASLCDYNRLTPQSVSEAISLVLLADTLILPGGVAMFTDGQEPLYPSCCCGLESWREWFDAIASGSSPWWGHDPTLCLEIEDGIVTVWPEGELSGNSGGESPYCRISVSDCIDQLKLITFEVTGFLDSLREWAAEIEHSRADELVRQIDRQMSLTCPPRALTGEQQNNEPQSH